LRNLNLDHLRTFVDVVELGSFSAAADRQKLSQPAISLQIRQLEKRLNVRLIERVGRKARPTAAGSDLLDHARRIDSAVAAALDGMARYATGAAGRVRIGTGATACVFLLPPALRDLRRRFPELDITVETGNTPDIVKAVQDNLLDVGLITLPASGRMLEFTPLIEDEFVAVASADTKLPGRVTADVLSQLPLLLFEPGGNTRHLVDSWLAEAGVPVRPVMSLGSVEAIKELVSAGLGCAVLPRLALRRDEESRDLVIRSLSPVLHRTLALVVRRDKQLHRGLRETLRALKGLAAAQVLSAAR
jgi:DNA-binding transcriptional LysR family regulator